MKLFKKAEDAAVCVSRKLCMDGRIDEEDMDLYIYGFREGIILLLNLITALLIGWIFGLFWENILFLTAFCILRKYAGGYHAQSREGCFVRSMLLVAAAMVIIRFIPIPAAVGIALTGMGGTLIWRLSPIENKKGIVSGEEMIYYRKLSRIAGAVEGAIIIALYLLHYDRIAQSVLMGILSVSVLQLTTIVLKRKSYTESK